MKRKDFSLKKLAAIILILGLIIGCTKMGKPLAEKYEQDERFFLEMSNCLV